ncbi:MAG: nicotinate-nucleotide--dimethylbenzimidazole phosphoribosyltransferase [Bacteroidales bacterium]|nr:nicotinate-nucleotide--dimethylbenzimidazole phosphoribosyltransferase [Bacteroidales bacterium]
MKIEIPTINQELSEALKHKIDTKTKPLGSLGKLEEIALKIGLIQNTLEPELKNPTILTFAADHGLADAGVSLYPKEVTWQMVMNFVGGGAAINVFTQQNGIKLKVVDAGVDYDFPEHESLIQAKMGRGTKNILEHPAMTIEQCEAAILKGRELVALEAENGCNTIAFGEMGIGNTSAASLLMSKFCDKNIAECTGRGTGHDIAGLNKKIEILIRCVQKHQIANDPIEVLATFGGFEIAMMCGAFLEAAARKMVIIVDGFIVTSALLAAYAINSNVINYCFFAHQSNEQAHKEMLEYLGAEGLLNFGLRLGEGTGAAIAFPLLQSAVNFLNKMASFESANVSDKS